MEASAGGFRAGRIAGQSVLVAVVFCTHAAGRKLMTSRLYHRRALREKIDVAFMGLVEVVESKSLTTENAEVGTEGAERIAPALRTRLKSRIIAVRNLISIASFGSLTCDGF
jgi:hypothetical protein